MNEDQANQIIKLLKEIKDHLENIESKTHDIESNTDEALQGLKNIKNNLR